MINSIYIEKMTSCDISNVKELESSQNINILSENTIKTDLKDDNYMYFIAKLNEEIVGYIAISKIFDTIDILSIVVKKEYQKQGIATKLLQFIFTLENTSKIMLEVRKSNIPAQMLYEKLEFKKIHIRKNYYSNPCEDAYIYEKIINNN